jgi:hypothetical protein
MKKLLLVVVLLFVLPLSVQSTTPFCPTYSDAKLSRLSNNCSEYAVVGYDSTGSFIAVHILNMQLRIPCGIDTVTRDCNWQQILELPMEPSSIMGFKIDDEIFSTDVGSGCLILFYYNGSIYYAPYSVDTIGCNLVCNPPTTWIPAGNMDFECHWSGSENYPMPDLDAIQLRNHPNPFSNSTELSFEIGHQERLAVVIYNVAGQRVRSIDKGSMPAGKHSIVWDGKDDSGQRVASGMYFYTVQTLRGVSAKKMVLLE